MSLSPENSASTIRGNGGPPTEDLSTHYKWTPPSTASSRRMIEEDLHPSYLASDLSFTSTQPSPTLSSVNLPAQAKAAAKYTPRPAMQGSQTTDNYRQACEEAERAEREKGGDAENGNGAGFKPSMPTRQQSWNEQDMRRKMQEGLFMTTSGKEEGFSEGNGK